MGEGNGVKTEPARGERPSDRLFLTYRRRGWRGFHFVRRLWCRAGGSPYVRIRTRYGSVMEVLPVGYIENFLLRHGYYEAEVFEALSPFLGEGAVFWDVGSNLGLHAVTAKTVFPATVIHAFEPVPELAARVRANAALNGGGVAVHGEALASRSGDAVLHLPRGGTSGRASLHALADVPDADQINARCVRADDLVVTGSIEAPTVVKIDVEGAEAEVLEGFGALLSDGRLRAVVFEGAPGLAALETRDPVGSRLCAAGFRLEKLERREPTHHGLENYLARR